MIKRNLNKTNILLKQAQHLFHTHDLRLLWSIENPHTLRKTIHRYVKNGTLIAIYKGFYSTVPLDQIDPIELGTVAIRAYSYLSTETVLVQSGIIFQGIHSFTFCSSKSQKYSIASNNYYVRQLQDKYLYNPIGIIDNGTYKIASPERAIADMLYFNPKYYFDAKDQIDMKKLKKIQKEVYAP